MFSRIQPLKIVIKNYVLCLDIMKDSYSRHSAKWARPPLYRFRKQKKRFSDVFGFGVIRLTVMGNGSTSDRGIANKINTLHSRAFVLFDELRLFFSNDYEELHPEPTSWTYIPMAHISIPWGILDKMDSDLSPSFFYIPSVILGIRPKLSPTLLVLHTVFIQLSLGRTRQFSIGETLDFKICLLALR